MPRLAAIAFLPLLALVASVVLLHPAAVVRAEGISFVVTGFALEGDNPLSAVETEQLLAPYIGPQNGLGGLEAAAEALQTRLREEGLAWHRAILPAQTLDGGTVRLKIVEFRIGRILVEGNEHFSDANILASVPALRSGISPASGLISRQLLIANEHPSKQVSVRMRASERPEEVDAVLAVKDRRPWSVFAGLNNTGDEQTGELRATLGFQHGNLFDRDHSLTASFTTSPEQTGSVRQYGAFYRVPFYRAGGVLSAFGVYSDIDSGTVAGDFDVSGRGTFLGSAIANC